MLTLNKRFDNCMPKKLCISPAIAPTRAGGIPEVVADDCGLLAPTEDPRALGDAMAQIANDPALAASMGANGKTRALDFSVERMTDRTTEVYKSVPTNAR